MHPLCQIAIVALTPAGSALASRLAMVWSERGGVARVFQAGRGAGCSLSELVRNLWDNYEGLVFIMAAGIAVRVISPLLTSKWTDPAVVVLDEKGDFAVSLVGGHWGGANVLARTVASLLGATPVVTTATDVWGKAAVDLLARKWGFLPVPGELVKDVNSSLLAGRQVVLYTEWEVPREFQGGKEVRVISGSLSQVRFFQEGSSLVFATSRKNENFPVSALFLCPPSLVAGLGCRRGVSVGEVEAALLSALARAGRHQESLAALATHEAKVNERGLREAARGMKLPLIFFSAGILRTVLQNYQGLRYSRFVQSRMGVGGVCEPAALAAAEEGTLVLPKTKMGMVTVALAEAGLLWSASGQAIRRI